MSTSATINTTLPIVSASDPGYVVDLTPPIISFSPSTPVTKVHPLQVVTPVTVYDAVKIDKDDVYLVGDIASINNRIQVDEQTVTFNAIVSASGNLVVSAIDVAGNSITDSSIGYVISGSLIDTTPPVITFSNYNPIDRFVLSGTSGSVTVTVKDENGSIAPLATNITLLEDSIGEIKTVAGTPVISAIDQYTIAFDVINIVNTGYVQVSARDDSGNASIAYDGKWTAVCANNDRLINLTNFLPSYLKDAETYEFTKFFENFLNTLYENKEKKCNVSILKKIERIAQFRDPSEIDIEFIQFFANYLGYNVDVTKSDLGTFNAVQISEEEINQYLRLVVQNLPNWYAIKTTRNAVKIMLFSFGIIGDIRYLFSNDYNQNWATNKDEDNNILSQIPTNYYPTPHFTVVIDLQQTAPEWIDSVSKVIDAINSIRPINTVFEDITGFFKTGLTIGEGGIGSIEINLRKQYTWHVPWLGSRAQL